MIKTCGDNNCFQLGKESNNKSLPGTLVRCPPLVLDIDITKISSLSTFSEHTVIVTNDGEAYGVGDNRDLRISGSLPLANLSEMIKIDLYDNQGQKCHIISAVCGSCYTLYQFTSPDQRDKNKLAYASSRIDNKSPLILEIGDSNVVSLFGGFDNAAAIDDDGSIIYVPPTISKQKGYKINAVSLPDHEKAVSLACCKDYVFALGQSGRVFISQVGSPNLKFEQQTRITEQLQDKEVIHISGSYSQCFAVTVDGYVFGFGTSYNGSIGIGTSTKRFDKFIEISILNGRGIKKAYAGSGHSLFQSIDGKVFACGENRFGQLGLNCDPSLDPFEVVETTIEKGAMFCIAGLALSVFFIGFEPPRCPNRRVERFVDEENSRLRAEVRFLRNEIESMRKKVEDCQEREKIYRKAVLDLVDI